MGGLTLVVIAAVLAVLYWLGALVSNSAELIFMPEVGGRGGFVATFSLRRPAAA